MFTNYTGLPAQHDQISSTLRQTLIAKTIRAYSCYTICPTTVISLLHIRSSNWKVVGCKGSRLSTVTIKYILYESIERQLMQAKVLLRRQFTLVQCSCCCLSPRYAIRNLDAPPPIRNLDQPPPILLLNLVQCFPMWYPKLPCGSRIEKAWTHYTGSERSALATRWATNQLQCCCHHP